MLYFNTKVLTGSKTILLMITSELCHTSSGEETNFGMNTWVPFEVLLEVPGVIGMWCMGCCGEQRAAAVKLGAGGAGSGWVMVHRCPGSKNVS